MQLKKKLEIDCRLQAAVNHHRAGDLKSAELFYGKLLGRDPENADALHLLGLINCENGDPEEAILKIKLAIAADPTFSDFHRSLGNVKKRIGQLEAALTAYQKAISLNPKDIVSLYEAGILHYHFGQLEAAESCFKKGIQVEPDHAGAYHNLGLVYRRQNRHRAALNCFKRALVINPNLAPARCHLAITLKDQGNLAAAFKELQRTVKIDPNYPEARYNLGLVQTEMGQSIEAVANYQHAIALKNDFAPAHNNLGILLQAFGRTREAMACFQQAIHLAPNNSNAHYNLGVLFRYHERYSDALTCLEKALEIDPDFYLARDAIMTHQRDICKWPTTLEHQEISGLGSQSKRWETVPEATDAMFEELSEDYLQKVMVSAKKQSHAIVKRNRSLSTGFRHFPKGFTGKKIIVGYLSNNFRDHPTAHLVCDLFANHNRKRFEIVCFSYGEDDRSAYRKKIEAGCDRFVDLFNLSSWSAASRIHQEKTHILVDLNGYTACNRADICGFRPAPVQLRYLGAAKTSAASFYDYLIGDRIVIPEEQALYYGEKLVFMPHSYQANSRPSVSEQSTKMDRQRFQLPVNGFVFCNFSTSYKIDPSLFKCWMRILDRVPESILWLIKRSPATESNLKHTAAILGIDPDRLIFTPPLPKSEHLARLRLADLCLDTRVVNGAATTSDALWAGVPVVTRKGSHFAARMSASILTAVGLPELVTNDFEQYEALSVALASDPAMLHRTRGKLEKNRAIEPLFDTRRFVCNLENAFEQMWAIYQSGESPRQIVVQDNGPIRPYGCVGRDQPH